MKNTTDNPSQQFYIPQELLQELGKMKNTLVIGIPKERMRGEKRVASFIKAAKPPLSVDAYELFLAEMAKHGLKDVQHGEFGAHMQVSLVNEGPCTIVIDTDEWKKKE